MTAVNKQLETIAYCCKYLHHICCSPRGCCWQCSLFAFNHSKIIWQEPHSRKTVICLCYGREVKYKNREIYYSLHNYPNFEQISGLYLRPNQISKMKIFHKLLHLRCLTGFWMPLWNLKTLKHQGKKLQFQQNNNTSTSSPAHLFTIRGKQKRGTGVFLKLFWGRGWQYLTINKNFSHYASSVGTEDA